MYPVHVRSANKKHENFLTCLLLSQVSYPCQTNNNDAAGKSINGSVNEQQGAGRTFVVHIHIRVFIDFQFKLASEQNDQAQGSLRVKAPS